MDVVAWIAALAAAAVHLLAFTWETLLFRRKGVHEGIFRVPSGDVPPVLLWAFNVGFYNLFLGSGAIAGVALWAAGEVTAGRTLVLYTSAFMALAGIVLFASDRMALSRPRGTGVGGAAAQFLPAAVALGAALAA